MCLKIKSSDEYSFLGIKDMRNNLYNFAFLGIKEFICNQKNNNFQLHGGIFTQYQYYFAKNQYGLRVLNDNNNQEIKLNYNIYFNDLISENMIEGSTYIKKRMGYHVDMFHTPKVKKSWEFYELNRLYTTQFSGDNQGVRIPIMIFSKDIQMISEEQAVVKYFTILEPKVLQEVFAQNNLEKLLLWEGNNNFMEDYKKIYESLINSMKIYALGEKNV